MALSKCAMKYAKAIVDPFHPSVRQACLPVFPSPPSHKVTSFVRVPVQVGTNGYGFIAIAPTLANDYPCAFASLSSYVGTTMNILSAANTYSAGINRTPMPNLPYSASQLFNNSGSNSQTVCGRIISFGLRISYTGTTLNESGIYTVYASPGHENVTATAANDPQTCGSLADAEVCPIGRQFCSARLYPVSPDETTYGFSNPANPSSHPVVYSYPYSSNDSNLGPFQYALPIVAGIQPYIGSPCLVVHVSGVAGSSFLVELVQHTEYIGSATAANATESDADQRGFEIVTAAAQRVPAIIQSSRQTPPSAMMSALREVGEALKPIAISAITKAAATMLL